MGSTLGRIGIRFNRTAVAALAVAALGFGIVGGQAHAQDNVTIGDGTPCMAGGISYPEGSIIKVGFRSYVCLKGVWWDAPEAFTSDGATLSVGTSHQTPSRLAGGTRAATLQATP